MRVCARRSSAHADWLAPDASYRDAQMQLRYATRDTVGHADDIARIDTLAVALLRLGRIPEAQKLFQRTLAAKPGDPAACAALGKLALWSDHLAQAESLLVLAGDQDQSRADLYYTRLRRAEWNEAAEMSEEIGDDGRKPVFERLAEGPAMEVKGERGQVLIERIWPAPLVKVKLNGTMVVMMVDTSTPGVLVDPMAVEPVQGRADRRTAADAVDWALVSRSRTRWCRSSRSRGSSTPTCVAGVISLRKLWLDVNPQASVRHGRDRHGRPAPLRGDVRLPAPTASSWPRSRAPRRSPARACRSRSGARATSPCGPRSTAAASMAMTLATGLPEGGVGAPDVVFEELGIKSTGVSKLVKGAGGWVQGRAWAQVNVASLTLGREVFDKLPGWSGALEPLEMWRHGVRKDGLLGPGILRGRRTTIDWTKRELVFED